MINRASIKTEELPTYTGSHREVADTSRWQVSVKGCGVFSPAARSAGQLFDILLGRGSQRASGCEQLVALDELHAASELRPREVKKLDRFSLLAITAARAAMREAALTPDQVARCGIVSGNMMCGWTFTEPQVRALHETGSMGVSPYLATAWFPAAPQGQVTIHLKMQGFAKTVTTDRCAGAQAIGMAFDRIRLRRSELLLAGGVEAPVTSFVKAAFSQLDQEPESLAEAAAYLLLAPGENGDPMIGAHLTFPVSRPDCLLDEAVQKHAASFASRIPEHLPVDTVVCNVPASAEAEESAARAMSKIFGGLPRLIYPVRAVGECLAASGGLAAAAAYMILTRQESSRSVLVLNLGHQCGDLLHMYRQH